MHPVLPSLWLQASHPGPNGGSTAAPVRPFHAEAESRRHVKPPEWTYVNPTIRSRLARTQRSRCPALRARRPDQRVPGPHEGAERGPIGSAAINLKATSG